MSEATEMNIIVAECETDLEAAVIAEALEREGIPARLTQAKSGVRVRIRQVDEARCMPVLDVLLADSVDFDPDECDQLGA